MKARCLLVRVALLALLNLASILPCTATVVTFDDLSQTSTGLAFANIPNGYQGFTWSNMFVVNALRVTAASGTNGNIYGMISSPNVAYNGFGFAEIDSLGTNFNFFSAYLTGVWNSNLNIEVQGFGSGGLLYDTTVVASATSPTLFTFDYLDINRLYFNSFGGQDAGFGQGAGEEFVMDNFAFEFIPEPSSLLLAALGGASLVVFLRRKRA
jgi:hypothetical protein